jgi:recombination protein RecA
MDGERIGQGKDSVKKYLMENPELAEAVEAKVRARLQENNRASSAQSVEAADRASVVSAEDFDDEI